MQNDGEAKRRKETAENANTNIFTISLVKIALVIDIRFNSLNRRICHWISDKTTDKALAMKLDIIQK